MSNEIIELNSGVEVTPVGLKFSNDISYDEWEGMGNKLRQIDGAVQWWIGDWLKYGERQYGEMYSQAVDETDYKYQRLADLKWVSEAYEFSYRYENVPWTHHRVIADMDKEERRELLDLVEKNEWSVSRLKQEKKKHERAKLIDANAQTEGPRFRLITDDVASGMQQLDKRSIDVIITDPPYPKEYLPLYGVLAEEARRVLKVGGLMVVMIGQSYLPDIIDLITPHLDYHWTACYQAPGASTQLWQRKVLTQWKPLLIFSSGEYIGEWLYDVVKSDRPDKDKHDWGQSESGMADVVKRYSQENDLILDPFCGAGTTGVVALEMGRRFVGIDIDKTQIEITAGRIAEL